MRSSRLPSLVLSVWTLCSAPTLSVAGESPHDRSGFVIGAHLGVGSSKIDHSIPNLPDGAVAGGAGSIRIGYAVAPELVVSAEVSGWGNESFGVAQSLSIAGVGLTWYPKRGGFHVRGVVGGGSTRYRTGQASIDREAEGPAAGLGVGYEWRIARALAIGAALDVARTDFEGGHAQWANVGFGLNIYP